MAEITEKQHKAAIDLVRRWMLAEGAERARLGKHLDGHGMERERLQSIVDYLVTHEGITPR